MIHVTVILGVRTIRCFDAPTIEAAKDQLKQLALDGAERGLPEISKVSAIENAKLVPELCRGGAKPPLMPIPIPAHIAAKVERPKRLPAGKRRLGKT